MDKRVLFATTNPGKFKSGLYLFKERNIQVMNLNDFPGVEAVEETGITFEENALLKAKGYFAQIGIPTIGDDGGLIVDYLGGAPGVYSRRFLGYEATDMELVEGILERLKGVPYEKRKAKLGGVMIFWDGLRQLTSEVWMEGYIAEKPGVMHEGLPWRSVFIIPQYGKVLSECTDEEREKINFRSRNLKNLLLQIEKVL